MTLIQEALRSRDDYSGAQQPRRPSGGEPYHSSAHQRRQSISRQEGGRSTLMDPHEQAHRRPLNLPSSTRAPRSSRPRPRADNMASPLMQASNQYQTPSQHMPTTTATNSQPGFTYPVATQYAEQQQPYLIFGGSAGMTSPDYGDGDFSTNPGNHATNQYSSANGTYDSEHRPRTHAPRDGGNDTHYRHRRS